MAEKGMTKRFLLLVHDFTPAPGRLDALLDFRREEDIARTGYRGVKLFLSPDLILDKYLIEKHDTHALFLEWTSDKREEALGA